jgi:alkylation response protein AidB-like acyl-CoA dehydrogenase
MPRHSGLIALLCKTDPDAAPTHRGVSILLVEKVPGFTISKDLPKLGYKGVESCELNFADCRVPATALLGTEEGRGFAQMMKGLEVGRLQVAARATGVARRRSRTRCDTPRTRRASASRSGSISPSATCSPTWAASCMPPARYC